MQKLFQADSIATSVGATTAANAAARFLGLIRGVALAWLITQDQFGLLGIALLVVNVMLPVCSAGIFEAAARYAPIHESAGTLRRFTLRCFGLVSVIAVGSTGLLGWFIEPFGRILFSVAATDAETGGGESRSTSYLAAATLLCVVVLSLYHTLLGLLRGLRMFRAVGLAELFVGVLFTLLAVGGAALGFASAHALVVTYALATAIVTLVFAPGLIVRVSTPLAACSVSPENGVERSDRQLLTFGIWAAAAAMLWQAMFYYPMWYLLKVSNAETVGAFHGTRLVAQVIHLAAAMLVAIISANITRLWEQTGRKIATQRLATMTKAAFLGFAGAAVLLSLARPIVLRMFPSTYATGIGAYDPLVLFFLLVGVAGLVAVRFHLLEKPRLTCLAWLAGATVNVLASFLLMPLSGESSNFLHMEPAAAAAWSGVAGVTTALVVCIGLVWRQRLPLDLRTMLTALVCFSVGFGPTVSVPAVALLIVMSLTTRLIFQRGELAELRRGLTRSV